MMRNTIFFCFSQKISTFAPSYDAILFYGVMVTRQILDLKFKVRALVEQQKY